MNEQLLAKLRSRYNPSRILELAEAGRWADAAEHAAKSGMWGLWRQLREASGLPCDESACNEWLAAYDAARKARFAK